MSDKYDDYYNFSDGQRICTPEALARSQEFQDADQNGKSAIASEYLADLRKFTLKEFADDPQKGLRYWKKDSEALWGNVSPSWGERVGEFAAGAARSIAYGAGATAEAAAHGAVTFANNVLTFPQRLAEDIAGVDGLGNKTRRALQNSIDSILPAGRVFDETANRHYRAWTRPSPEREVAPQDFQALNSRSKFVRDGKFFRNIEADHSDDVQNLIDAADAFSISKTPENFTALQAAEKAALKSGAEFNGENPDNYGSRSFEKNQDTRRLLEVYLQTNSPEVRAALNNIYGKSDADLRSDAVIQAFQKRALDFWGNGFIGRERANMLEYADASEAASTLVEGALTFGAGKLVHGAVAGVKAAKGAGKAATIMSKADRIKNIGKAVGGIGLSTGSEILTERYQTQVENPFPTDKQMSEATIAAAGQSLLLGGLGVGAGAVTGRIGVPKNAKDGLLENEKPQSAKSVDLGYESAPVVEMPVENLKLSKEVPNFKEGASADTGVVEGQQLQGNYERVGTAPIVVWQRENGDTEVITGRHRLDLAKRTGEKTIPAYVVNEADGFTANDARTFDAESNIRDENGSVRDYAHYFRNKDIAIEEAEAKGLLSRKKGLDGWAIGKLAEDELYTQYRNGKISADRAAAIANGAPNDAEIQRAALASSEGMDSTTLEIHARRLAAYKNEVGSQSEGVQGDLFGEDDSAIKEMVAISKAAGALVKENRQKILAVKGVVKRPEVAKEMGVDINDPEAVKAAIADLERENQMLMSPTPDRNILNKIRAKAGLAELPNVEGTVVDSQNDSENVEQNDTLDFGLAESGSILPQNKGKFLSKIESRIKEFLNELKGKILNDEEKGIVSVIKGDKKYYHIRIDDLGNIVAFLKGSRDKTGANHIMVKHYGQNARMGYVSAEEILQIGEIIRNGNLKIVNDNERRYVVKDPNYNERNLTVVVKKSFKKAQPDFVFTFYSNKKAEEVRAKKQALGTTPSDLSSSTVLKESENSSESQAENSQNDSGASGSVRHKGSTPFAGGGVSDSARANADYQALKNAAQEVRKTNPSIWSRWISKSRAYLPKSVNFNRALNRIEGVPSIGDIRRYAQKVLDIPIAKKMRLDNPAWLGVYDRDMQYIRTRSGHYNDFDVLAHEMGHYLETVFFGNTLGEAKLNVASELRGYCYERFGDAYPAKDMAREGWAQFISDVLNDVNDAKLKCPIAFGVLENALVDNPNVAGVFENIRQMAELNRNANAWDRSKANIKRQSDMDKTPLVEKLKDIPRTWRRKMLDSNEAIAVLAKELDEQKPGEGQKLVALTENYVGGHIGQSEYSLLQEQIDLDGNVIGKSLRTIYNENLKTAFDRENIDAYLIAARAKEYFKQNPKAIKTCRQLFGLDYQDVLDITSTASVAMQKCAEGVYQYLRNDLKMGLDGGLLSQEQYDSLLKNKAYVPLQRFMEFINPDAAGGGTGHGLANAQSPLKSFKGSDREIIDVFESIANNSQKWREAACKNRIAKRIVNSIQNAKSLGDWASPYPEKVSRTQLTLDQWAEAILDSGLWGREERNPKAVRPFGDWRKRAIDKIKFELEKSPELRLYLYEEEAVADAKEQVVTFYENGKKVAWQIHDKGLYDALAGMDGLASKFFDTIVGKIISTPAKMVRATATEALGFVGANFARDNVTAGATSRNGFVPFFSSIKWGLLPVIQSNFGKRGGFLRALNDEGAKAYDEWVANGGRFATQIEAVGGLSKTELTADAIRREEGFDAALGAWLKQFKRAPLSTAGKTLLKPFENLSRISEEMTRVAEFRLAKENAINKAFKDSKGAMSRAEAEAAAWQDNADNRRNAANDSKRVTLNFSRGGTWARNINQAIPFFNAAMQGLDKLYTEINPVDFPKLLNGLYSLGKGDIETSAKNLKGVAKKRESVNFVKAVAIASIVGSLELAFSSQQTDELPEWRKRRFWNFDIGGTVVSIPKSQEIAPLCEVFTRAINTWQIGKLDVRAGEFAETIDELLLPSLIPQIAKPFLENYMNYSFFRNAPIENYYQRKQLPSTRKSDTTTLTSQWLAQKASAIGVEVSPLMIDNLSQGLFSSLGRDFLRNVSDPLVQKVSGMPSAPEKKLSDYPLTSAFFHNNLAASVYVGKFYDTVEEFGQLSDLANRMDKGKISERPITEKQKRMLLWYGGCAYGSNMPRYKELRQIQAGLSEINTVMTQIRNSQDLTPKQKREALENCVRDKNKVCKKAFLELSFSEDNFRKWANN